MRASAVGVFLALALVGGGIGWAFHPGAGIATAGFLLWLSHGTGKGRKPRQ